MSVAISVIAFGVFLAATTVAAAPPVVAKPLHLVAKSAIGISIVKTESIFVSPGSFEAEYRIDFINTIRGARLGSCLLGPSGMKANREYIVFLQLATNSKSNTKCGDMKIGGVHEPEAFEVVVLGDQGKYVKLDNVYIIPPEFVDAIEIKQRLLLNDGDSTVILGTAVPFETFINYISNK